MAARKNGEAHRERQGKEDSKRTRGGRGKHGNSREKYISMATAMNCCDPVCCYRMDSALGNAAEATMMMRMVMIVPNCQIANGTFLPKKTKA